MGTPQKLLLQYHARQIELFGQIQEFKQAQQRKWDYHLAARILTTKGREKKSDLDSS